MNNYMFGKAIENVHKRFLSETKFNSVGVECYINRMMTNDIIEIDDGLFVVELR